MEDWSRSDFINLEILVIAAYTFLCYLLSLKISINPASAIRYQSRYAFYVWSLGVLCIVTACGVWMVVRPPFPTQASNSTVQPSPSPCLTAATSSPTPATQKPQPSSPKSRQKEPVSLGDVNFVIDSINYEYSRFPVQGRFPVKYQVEPNADVRIIVSSPSYRVTGRSSATGTRQIAYIRAGINTYTELNKIYYGQRGTAEWSDWVKVDLEVPAGPEPTKGQPIEMVVPRATTDALSNKGLIIQMRSVLKTSGEEQYPSCVLSNGNVFSGH